MWEPDTRGDTQAVATASLQTRYGVYFRFLMPCDLREIAAIEALSFDRPWTRDDFVGVMKNPRVCGIVIERGERTVGYMIYRFAKQFGQRYLEVERIAVHPEFRGHGIGRQAVEKLREKLANSASLRKVVIPVRERNLVAQRFLRACGVRADMVLPDHFDDGEDAYQFIEPPT